MKKKKIGWLLIFLLMLLTLKVEAKIYSYQYKYTKPYAYIFWTGKEDCHECQKTISIIKSTIYEAFDGRYMTYVINYWQDREYNYQGIYNLTSPLSVVVINVRDDTVIGSKKIVVETNVSDLVSFKESLVFQIKEFLE